MNEGWSIPAHSVRESKRARRVTIKVSPRAGLEVVVPVGFDRSEIPEILKSKASWITKHLERARPDEELKRPVSIRLESLGETWLTEYLPSPAGHVKLSEREGRVLSMTGPVDNPVMVAAALNR